MQTRRRSRQTTALLRHAAHARSRSLNAQLRRRHVLSLSPTAPLERRRTRLDGIRAQARQARRSELACFVSGASESAAERFSLVVGNIEALAGHALRDHARYRHAVAARRRAAVRRHDGAPVEPSRFDRRRSAGCARATASCSRGSARACRAANRSVYARLYSGDPGIDPYTRTVSDVYQDLFGEGSFIGKGIYDVDAFEQSLQRQVSRESDPQPRSSRGLLCAFGLLSDVELFEDYPATLRDRHRPPAPLDPRRLADRELAVAVGAGARGPACTQPAFGVVAVEDRRQPAPQPGAGGAAAAVAGRHG